MRAGVVRCGTSLKETYMNDRKLWTEGDAESFMRTNRDARFLPLNQWGAMRQLLVAVHNKGFRAGQTYELTKTNDLLRKTSQALETYKGK